ncbi:PKD domain protein [anaerobic digester metagenome]
MRNNNAVSELIGALLITGVIAGGIGLIAVILISQPPPVDLPAADFKLVIDDNEKIIRISHVRGDSLRVFDESGLDDWSSIHVNVDGELFKIVKEDSSDGSSQFKLIKNSPNPDDLYYAVGDVLEAPFPDMKKRPENVQFIYKDNRGGEYVLWGYGGKYTPGTVSFSYTPANPYPCDLIQFRDTSSVTATSWSWDFNGDGVEDSRDQNPLPYQYVSPGTKTVTLTVSNGIDTWKTSRIVTVHSFIADFSFVPSTPTTGTAIQFSDSSKGNPEIWEWNFGDGSSIISGNDPAVHKNPSYTYSDPDTYLVQHRIGKTSSSCSYWSEWKQKPIKITECTPISGLSFSYTPDTICINSRVLFRSTHSEGSEPISYAWIIDGIQYNEQNHYHVFTQPGSHSVILRASNCAGSVEPPPRDVLAVDCSCSVKITSTPTAGGSILPSGEITLSCGSDQIYTITPDPCYAISDVLVDDVSQGPISSYTFEKVVANHKIEVRFENPGNSYQIESISGPGGSISPSDITSITCGNNQDYTITADPCYVISDVLIDDVSQGPISSYTFESVQSNHKIEVHFEHSGTTYQIESIFGSGGSISPSGIFSIPCGNDKAFTITPDPCYKISDVLVDGVSIPGPFSNPYVYSGFTNVQKDYILEAVFTEIPYNITTSVTGNGVISPGTGPVLCGSSPMYTITADPCNYISSILVDGIPLSGPFSNPYVYSGFTNVQQDHTLSAVFTGISYNITTSTTGSGTITPGSGPVLCDSSPVYTITADPCNRISSIIVDGNALTGPFESPYNYSGFSNVQEDHTIEAVFIESPLTITTIITGNGVISPGTGPVLCGSSPIYTITAGSCNRISSILIDGIPLSGPFSNPYVYSGFANIQEDHIIEAVFTPDTFNITATAGTGGSISPSGVVPVTCGGSQTFTFTPDSGYEIDGIIVDGQSIGVVNSYTFTDVQEDHTIYVNFGNTGYCLIAGYITDETTGLGVPGIKVDVWNEDRTMILRSGISQSNGYYAIKHPKPKKSYWVDVNCPDQGNWRTNDPVSRWYNNVHLNPAAYCDQTNINFSGRLYSNIVENVFIHGQRLSFSGDTIMGHGSTVIITGGLNTASTNLGAQIGATTIYIDGDVDLATGSAGLGSSTKPGNIYINGDLRLWNGQREIYGDVYVNGNFDLKDARIHGMVFVDGDLTLGWTPYLATDARIFYTGQIHYPNNYDQNILSKCIKWDKVPGFTIPDGLPSLKPDDWYSSNGYGTGGLLTSGMKVFADSYSSTGYRPSATNVIIVAKTGDITITGLGGSSLTGIFFAPYGKVTFGGGSLQGLILTRDGFFVTSGGTDVTFLPIHHYISNPSEYPFQ